MAVAVGESLLSISKTIAFRPAPSQKCTIEVLPALVQLIDRQPDDVPIGAAIPVPGGFANDALRFLFREALPTILE